MAKTPPKKRSAGNSAKTAGKTTRGKPFAKGNVFAFKPGQSGNPAGRPRDTITPHLREIAQEQDGRDKKTYGRKVAEMLFAEAIGGNVQAAKEILDRLDGRPKQSIDLTVDDRMRSVLEVGIETLIKTGLTETEAKEYLSRFVPEVEPWIN